MNDDRPELEQNERQTYPPGEAGQRQRQTSPDRARQQPGRIRLSVLSLVISVIALITAAAALAVALRGNRETELPPAASEPPAEEPVTFRFGGKTLTPIEGMPLNPYDREAFGLDGKGRVTYEADGLRARTGVDVSTHQKEIDWQAAAEDGISFAILRLGRRGYTEGGLFLDETFEQNLQGALDAGLEVGVYFFSQAVTPEEAEEEADYVLRILDGRELALPVAFDWETISGDQARTDGMDGAAMTRCAAAFCKRIRDGGYRPAVYFNQTQGYLHYDLRELAEYALWLAEYDAVPDFYYHFDLWQYSHSGHVDGIEGDVDLDLAFW
ncbi:MAG: glycoside hydrolase [Oscillibacter sp.]|nr:glycoside hydrolase [Oscillibacter sp.]